jgi:hypothetical protein
MTAQNPRRTGNEIALLSKRYGDLVFDPEDLTMVLIERFDLPSGFNRPYSRLLIDLGPRYPELPPQDWYLDRGLLKNGKPIPHYFEVFYEKRYVRYGFAWYCLHLKGWMPNPHSIIAGDNLVIATESVFRSLKEY